MKHRMIVAGAVLSTAGACLGQDCGLAGGVLLEDLNGDGVLNPADIALWLVEQIGTEPLPDLDGDGFITQLDLELFLEDFVRGFAGDLNADGTVNELDLIILVQNVGADESILINHGDLNADGTIDEADFAMLAERVGCPLTDEDVESMVQGLIVSVGYLQAGDPVIPAGEIVDHKTYFTSTWPHGMETSQLGLWPPNHEGSITSQWDDPPVHNELQSERWGPNHLKPISDLWDLGNHEEGTSTYVHDTEDSSVWPPNHKLQRSDGWPEDHLVATSRSWPPSHLVEDSVTDGTSPHETFISSKWIHGVESSGQSWPPSHPLAISGSWTEHDTEVSMTWPPGHFMVPSETWDGDKNWPPNHFQEDSEEWVTPTTPLVPPLPPIWDPEHAIIISIIDIVPG